MMLLQHDFKKQASAPGNLQCMLQQKRVARKECEEKRKRGETKPSRGQMRRGVVSLHPCRDLVPDSEGKEGNTQGGMGILGTVSSRGKCVLGKGILGPPVLPSLSCMIRDMYLNALPVHHIWSVIGRSV